MARSLAADIEGEMYPVEFRTGLGYIWKLTEIQQFTFASDVLFKKDIEYSDLSQLDPIKRNFKFFEGVEYSHNMSNLLLDGRFGLNFTGRKDRAASGFGAGVRAVHCTAPSCSRTS